MKKTLNSVYYGYYGCMSGYGFSINIYEEDESIIVKTSTIKDMRSKEITETFKIDDDALLQLDNIAQQIDFKRLSTIKNREYPMILDGGTTRVTLGYHNTTYTVSSSQDLTPYEDNQLKLLEDAIFKYSKK